MTADSSTLSAIPPSTHARYDPPPIAGRGYRLAPLQAGLLEIAERLGREKLAPRAAQYDRDASFPFENFDDLRTQGFLRICIPEDHGGLGADYGTYMLVAAELGRHCAATALTWDMHVCSTLWTGALADALDMTVEQRAEHEAHRRLHFERIARHGKVYAQPFSESSAAAAGKAPFGTLAAKVEGGWVLNGRKIFASLSGAADYYGILCTESRQDRSVRDTLYLAVPGDTPGFSIVGDWDPMGMRATVSRTLVLNDVFVPDEAQLMPRGLFFQATNRWPHMLTTLTPTYMGLAQAAYDFTIQYLRGEIPAAAPAKRRMYPTKQYAVAQMHVRLEQTRALFLRVVDEAKLDPTKDERLRLYAAHYTVMENASEIAQMAIRTCGGQSIMKSLPLERIYRDSRCGSLMLPLTAELCLDRIGREALYEPGEADD